MTWLLWLSLSWGSVCRFHVPILLSRLLFGFRLFTLRLRNDSGRLYGMIKSRFRLGFPEELLGLLLGILIVCYLLMRKRVGFRIHIGGPRPFGTVSVRVT
nr:hypothetical protein Iba_chr13fCG6020 [Ipomoea batatas]